METTRQKKISRLIQKELSSIFQKELPIQMGNNVLSTVTVVRVSQDLANANVYISFFPENDTGIYLKLIKHNSKLYRKILGNNLRSQLRIIPDLSFFLDNSASYSEEIERLLKK
tara:strand:- start:14217 stop:14558 length:342 start_codon:yes stop_codon:yes gene_type:complete